MRKVSSNVLRKNFQRSFISHQADQEMIWRKLFVDSEGYSDILYRLLVIDQKDCLDETQAQYKELISQYNVGRLKKEGYITAVPRIQLEEHETNKTYILFEMDNMVPNGTNPEYMDSMITFTIFSNFDSWELNDYQIRPWVIAGYINGLLNGSRLTGIGKLECIGASQFAMNEHFGGVMIRYNAVHGQEDNDKVDNTKPSINQLS